MSATEAFLERGEKSAKRVARTHGFGLPGSSWTGGQAPDTKTGGASYREPVFNLFKSSFASLK